MPGPSNAKRKAAKSKKKKTAKPTVKPTVETTVITESSTIQSSNGSSSSSPSPDLLLLTPPPLSILSSCISIPDKHPPPSMPQLDLHHIEEVLCQKPFIHDPGNGPRVRDTRAFLASSYFSQPPALDVRYPVFRSALESRLSPNHRSHYVPKSHKTRCYRCYAPSYQKKPPWCVP